MPKCARFLYIAMVLGVLSFVLYAQEEPTRPDVAKMTMDQLLDEFRHPGQTIPGETMLTKPPPQRRVDIINALRRLGDPLVAKLRNDLVNPDPKVKIAAAQVLLNLGNVARPAVPELVAAMSDPDPGVRRNMVIALGNLKDPRAFDALVNATHDSDSGVRYGVLMYAFPSLADARFALAVQALSDKDKNVRLAGITQLTWIRDKRAVAFLAPLLDDVEVRNYSVREGIKTSDRNCDDVVHALEYLVNGTYVAGDKGNQEEHDLAVKKWQTWWKTEGPEFDRKLYAEPPLLRATK